VLSQSPVAVLHTEGLVHGFLALRTLEGNALADGEVTRVARGDRVTSHLVFRFKDGSVHEETVVFSQRNSFRVISDHLVQKGLAFKRPMDVSIEGLTGQVTVRYTDDDGKEKTESERLKLPPDIANGMTLTLLKNIRPNVPQTTVLMVAANPKPRLVKLLISPEGEDSFSAGGSSRKSYALCHKGRDWRRRRISRALGRGAAARHPRVDSRRGCARFRQIGRPALPGRAHMADRTD
jgi:hypothetical protein